MVKNSSNRRFSAAQLDDLRQRYPVDAEAGKHVTLRAVRQGEFVLSGPCPLHSPDPKARDSTSFACNSDVWVCTECGGGDIFELVGRLNGLKPKENGGADFLKAVELVGGVRDLSAEEQRALDDKRAADRLTNDSERNAWRDAERGRSHDIYYKYSMRLSAPEAKAGRDYLCDARGLDFPPNVWLRFNPAMRFYMPDKPKHRLIHAGPALTLQLQRRGEFVGVHITWFDLARPKGKPLIVDPKNGEQPRNKKMRGSKAGAHGDLTGWIKAPETLVLGEGLEKVLAVWTALNAGGRDLALTGFWSACDLGNLGGPAADSLPHPTLKTPTDRAKHVPGIVPDRDKPAIDIPDSVTRLILIGDATSDPFQTQCAMARAAARYARPGREVVCAWSPEGKDFDDLLREAAE
jgi:hypothetical protein